MPLDRSTIDALGRRLERAKAPAQADLDELAILQNGYLPSLEIVTGRLRDLLGSPPSYEGTSLTATSRLKTVATIVEKLRNHETKLSLMRDIVGVRIVGGLNRAAQNRLVALVASTFAVGESGIIDRRRTPRHGYRAVHVVPRVDERPVEIQIRTGLQHTWANGMERFADVFGRQIRYGGEPSGSSAEQQAHRWRFIEEYKRHADLIETFELAELQVLQSKEELRDREGQEDKLSRSPGGPAVQLEELQTQHQAARRALVLAAEVIASHLVDMTELLDLDID